MTGAHHQRFRQRRSISAEADRVTTDDVVRQLLDVVPESDDEPSQAAAVDRAIP